MFFELSKLNLAFIRNQVLSQIPLANQFAGVWISDHALYQEDQSVLEIIFPDAFVEIINPRNRLVGWVYIIHNFRCSVFLVGLILLALSDNETFF